MVLKFRNKEGPWAYIFISLWFLSTLALGLWWLYLIMTMGKKLQKFVDLFPGQLQDHTNFSQMVIWEGLFFLALVFLGSLSLIYLFLQNRRHHKALSSFLAAFTHEIKTPLASIRLQAEVIESTLKDQKHNEILVQRLLEDTGKLEDQVNNILAVARVERGVPLPSEKISLRDFLSALQNKLQNQISKENLRPLVFTDQAKRYLENQNFIILANYFALQVIFLNLYHNSHRHSVPPKEKDKNQKILIDLKLSPSQKKIILVYKDPLAYFQGDSKRLGTIFYTYNSPQGQGIGLYLVKRLLEQMGGTLKIEHTQNRSLVFYSSFRLC